MLPLTLLTAAEHEALVPPLLPAQLHDQGPLPATVEAEPVEQRLVVGAVLTVVPLAVPQVPFTAVGALGSFVATQLAPAHDHQFSALFS